MQGLPEGAENGSNCQQSVDDHHDQARPATPLRNGVHAPNENKLSYGYRARVLNMICMF